jgi:hypothetical protein
MFGQLQFLAEITLIDSFSQEFIQLIPEQRKVVDDLMNKGIIVSYALSMERKSLWVIFESKDENEVLNTIYQFPLIRFMKPKIHELAFYDTIHNGFPQLSLN